MIGRVTAMMKDNVRKIVKNGKGSYYINIPKEIIKELKWRERQKVVVKKYGKKGVLIQGWPG